MNEKVYIGDGVNASFWREEIKLETNDGEIIFLGREACESLIAYVRKIWNHPDEANHD